MLLLRIGDLTIVEWSHAGKVRIWPPGHASAPQLTARYFDGTALKPERDKSVAGHSHHGSETGAWQDRVARAIHRETGVQINHFDYMPRR